MLVEVIALTQQFGGLPKLGVPFWGVPIISPIIFWGLYWGPPILGNYHGAGSSEIRTPHTPPAKIQELAWS